MNVRHECESTQDCFQRHVRHYLAKSLICVDELEAAHGDTHTIPVFK